MSAVCDGVNDCGLNDDSDEKSCSLFHKCTPNQFQCESDQYCISKQFHCDGEANCDDGSDEINCKTPICGFGACSQVCLEKKSGHYNCRCLEGYATKGPEKNSTCRSNEEPLLLIASDRDLRFLLPLKLMDSEVHGRIPVSKHKIDVFDMQILHDIVYLYWITTPNRRIEKSATTLLGRNYKRTVKRAAEQEAITIATSIENPKSLAIDWIGEHIYILDAKHHQIVTTDLNGNQLTTITSTGSHPIDIIVDPKTRKMFWSTLDKGIISASMDGSNKHALVDRGIEWATGMTIDDTAQRLYWVDNRKGTVETILLNGKSRHIITQFKNHSKLTV